MFISVHYGWDINLSGLVLLHWFIRECEMPHLVQWHKMINIRWIMAQGTGSCFCLYVFITHWSAPSHYLNQRWNIVNRNPRNNLQWNCNRYTYIFIQENAFENVVWKIAAILFRSQCVMPVVIKLWTQCFVLLQLILLRQRSQQYRPGISFFGLFTVGKSSVLTVWFWYTLLMKLISI